MQVANRNSLSVRMDEIKFGQFISANIGFFAASYLVFYPAELLKTRQQVSFCALVSPVVGACCSIVDLVTFVFVFQVSRHVHAGAGFDPYSVRGLMKDL